MDPGWNDPPMLNYTSTNPPPKTRIGNKRIAFPITGTPPANHGTGDSAAKLPNAETSAQPPR